jgi:hypothetical protein
MQVKQARVKVIYQEKSTPPKAVSEELILSFANGEVSFAGEANPNQKRMDAFREAADTLNHFLGDASMSSVSVATPFAPEMSFWGLVGGGLGTLLALVHFLSRSTSQAEVDAEVKTLHLHLERRWRSSFDTTLSISGVQAVWFGGYYYRWIGLKLPEKTLRVFFGFGTPLVWRETPKVATVLGEFLGVTVIHR